MRSAENRIEVIVNGDYNLDVRTVTIDLLDSDRTIVVGVEYDDGTLDDWTFRYDETTETTTTEDHREIEILDPLPTIREVIR